MHGEAAGGVEKSRSVTTVDHADRVVGVLAGNGRKDGAAGLDFD